MIGRNHTLKGQDIKEFIQSLSALNYDLNSNAVGMMDGIFANNSIFTKSGSIRTSNGSYLILDGLVTVDLYTLNSFSVASNLMIPTESTTANVIFSHRDSAGPMYQPFIIDSEIRFNIRDSDNVLQVVSYDYSALYSVGDIINVECELVDIQTATPTMTLYIDGVAMGTLTYTKGVTLTSTKSTFKALYVTAYLLYGEMNALSDFWIKENGVKVLWFPFDNINADPVCYEVINGGGYNFSSFLNTTLQDGFHYLMTYGAKHDGNRYIPALADKSGPSDLSGSLTHVQNGIRFLDVGTLMKNADVQELKDADTQNVWFDGVGVQKEITVSDYADAVSNYPSIYGGNVGSNYVDTLTLK